MENKPAFVISKEQKVILKELGQSPLREKFYWTGGTALAFFYLQHRKSYDIDLFSDVTFQYTDIIPFVQKIKERLKLRKTEEKKVFDRWQFFLHNNKEVRLEFAWYDFSNLKPRKKWNNISVDSLDDMAANKTMAMIDRHEPKDAFDIYFLINKLKYTPKSLLDLVKKKFETNFPLSLFLSQSLLGSKGLHEIRPLLYQNQVQSKTLLQEIVKYFENTSAQFMRNQFS